MNNFVNLIIYYIPLVISAFVVLLIGLLIVDFISDLVKTLLVSAGIDEKFERTAFWNLTQIWRTDSFRNYIRTSQTIWVSDLSYGCIRYSTADYAYPAADKYYSVSATSFHRYPDPDDRSPFH